MNIKKNITIVIQDVPFTGKEKVPKKQKLENIPRPDITHHILLTIIDSPLYKTGNIKIFLKTINNILIQINPLTRIPRTFSRFEGLMNDCLKKLMIKSENKVLLKVIKNKIDFLGKKIGLSAKGEKICKAHFENEDLVLFISAKQKGEESFENIENLVKVSDMELSAACAIGKVIYYIEGIVGIF